MDSKHVDHRPDQSPRPHRPVWQTPDFEDIGVSAEVTAYAATWKFDLD